MRPRTTSREISDIRTAWKSGSALSCGREQQSKAGTRKALLFGALVLVPILIFALLYYFARH